MGWNNAYERKKFEAKQKKQAEEYRALGMTEEQIQIMYEFDLEQFNSNRSYYSHTQSFIPDDFDESEDDDEKLSIFEKRFSSISLQFLHTISTFLVRNTVPQNLHLLQCMPPPHSIAILLTLLYQTLVQIGSVFS